MKILMRLLRRLQVPDSLAWLIMSKVTDGATAARSFGVSIGSGTRIYCRQFGSEPWLVSIGTNSCVSFGVVFITHDASGWLFRDEQGSRSLHAPIEIGDDVFIGAHAILLPGVRIGSKCIVGAGSVVTKSIPAGTVVAGNPARVIGNFEDLRNRALTEWVPESAKAGMGFRESVDKYAVRTMRRSL